MLALPIKEFVVLDMGSNDSTRQVLEQIAYANPRVRIEHGNWSRIDAGAFADVANECVDLCDTPNVLFYQADEIWHPNLLPQIESWWNSGIFELSFWRIQLKKNFQEIKWWPHLIHRCVVKGRSTYIGDGMNTDRTWDARLCSAFDGGWMQRWFTDFEKRPEELPWSEFVFDVHASFDKNMVGWRKLHAPFWHEDKNTIEGLPKEQWLKELEADPRLDLTEAPYTLPPILEGCVGMGFYKLRGELLDALKCDVTKPIVCGK
jgi:hypothetical protein